MVRLYYMAIIQKDGGQNPVLQEGSDLSDFYCYKKDLVKEYFRFICQKLVGRIDPEMNVTIREKDYACHVFVLRNYLATAAVTDNEYPAEAAHVCLQVGIYHFVLYLNNFDFTPK